MNEPTLHKHNWSVKVVYQGINPDGVSLAIAFFECNGSGECPTKPEDTWESFD